MATRLKIKVTNDGASEADAVTIVDDLPAGLHATAVSSTAGTCTLVDSPADLDVLVDDVSCTLASLASGASVTVTVTYSADADLEGGTVKTNTAAADADDTDNTTHPVTDSDTVAIGEVVDLDVVKDFSGDDPETVTAGSTGNTFTITVTNDGPSNADDVQLTDSVDARLDVTGVSTDTGTCAAPAQLVACDLNDLAPGASAVITVTYSVAADEDPADVGNAATATDADANTATGAGHRRDRGGRRPRRREGLRRR